MLWGFWKGKRKGEVVSKGLSGFGSVGLQTSVEGGVRLVDVVYAALNYVANSFRRSELCVVSRETGEVLPSHPLVKVLYHPSPFITKDILLSTLIYHLYIYGMFLMEKVYTRGGKLTELRILNPEQVTVDVSELGVIQGFKLLMKGGMYTLPPEKVVYVRNPDLADPLKGFPLLAPAVSSKTFDGLHVIGSYVYAFLENLAIPPVVVTLSGRAAPEELELFSDMWQRTFGGRNRGRVLVASGIEKVDTIKADWDQASLPGLSDRYEAKICSLIGVPPILLGLKVGLEHSSYANYEQARLAFFQNTILGLQALVDDQITGGFESDFKDVEIRFDNSGLPEVLAENASKVQAVQTGVKEGWATVNEVRRLYGLEEVPGGEVFLRPLSVIPVSASPTPTKSVLAIKAAAGDREVQLNRMLRLRSSLERWRPFIESGVLRVFSEILPDIKRMLKSLRLILPKTERGDVEVKTGLDPEVLTWIRNELNAYKEGWAVLANGEFRYGVSALMKEALIAMGGELGIEFSWTDEEIQEFISTYAFKFSKRFSDSASEQVRDVIQQTFSEPLTFEESYKLFMEEFTVWTKEYAKLVARTELIRSANAASHQVFRLAGFGFKEWSAAIGPDTCEFCQALDGKIIEMDEEFVKFGEDMIVEVEGAVKRLSINYEPIMYPPLHPNCRCTFLAREGIQ